MKNCPDGQFLSCGCETSAEHIPWSGEWPGVAECEELGLYAYFTPGEGWVKCSKDHPQAVHDLNTLYSDYKLDAKLKKFVKRC
jgi:hypothetical protein